MGDSPDIMNSVIHSASADLRVGRFAFSLLESEPDVIAKPRNNKLRAKKGHPNGWPKGKIGKEQEPIRLDTQGRKRHSRMWAEDFAALGLARIFQRMRGLWGAIPAQ